MNRSRFPRVVVGTLEPPRPANGPAAGRPRDPQPSPIDRSILRPEDSTMRRCSDHTFHVPPGARARGDEGVAMSGRAGHVAASIRPEHEPLEIDGCVDDLGLNRIVLTTRRGVVRLSIEEGTIVFIDGGIATPAELAIGEHVRVDALPTPDGSLIALLVVAEAEEVELSGSILCLTEGALTLETAAEVVDVGLTDDTVVQLLGHDGSLADLRVGMHVEVIAESFADRLSALLIEVEDDFDLVELEGEIVSVSSADLALATSRGTEVVLAVTPDTFVLGKGELIALRTLQPGDRVEAKAFRDPDDGLVALRIKVDEPVRQTRSTLA